MMQVKKKYVYNINTYTMNNNEVNNNLNNNSNNPNNSNNLNNLNNPNNLNNLEFNNRFNSSNQNSMTETNRLLKQISETMNILLEYNRLIYYSNTLNTLNSNNPINNPINNHMNTTPSSNRSFTNRSFTNRSSLNTRRRRLPDYIEISVLGTPQTPQTNNEINLNNLNSLTTIDLYRNVSNTESTDLDNTDDNIEEMCSICRVPFEENDIIRRINGCNHIFHQNCIDTWFQSNSTCPHCRLNLNEQANNSESTPVESTQTTEPNQNNETTTRTSRNRNLDTEFYSEISNIILDSLRNGNLSGGVSRNTRL